MRRLVRSAAGFAGFFLVWELASRTGLVSPASLPPPSQVFAQLVELLGDRAFLLDTIATALAWAIALLLAIAIAVPGGLLLGSLPRLRAATRAIVELLRPIPSVALIPPAIVMIGGGPGTKIALAAYASLWPILFHAIYALDEMDPLLVDSARSCGASRARILWAVALPHAAPFLLTGIRLSAAIALITVISTEFMAGAVRGIGRFILEATEGSGRMDLVLAGTVVAGLFGYLVNDVLERIGRRWFRWSTTVREPP